MNEIQRHLASKSGRMEDCEDALTVTNDFACVVDGATSQSDLVWNGQTGGQVAARLICQIVESLQADVEATYAVKLASDALSSMYAEQGLLNELKAAPWRRASASCVIYSRRRRQLWMVGDCQCLMVRSDGELLVENRKEVDRVNAQARALLLGAELQSGKTISELQTNDVGRQLIEPLLRGQRAFQNPSSDAARRSEFAYWVIDGFSVPPQGIKQVRVGPDVEYLVLASDGYPILCSKLEESEAQLDRLMREDPLLIHGPHKSTKGLVAGNESFDDRAYLKVEL